MGVYEMLSVDGDFFEVCDECGFNGALIDMSTAAALLNSLGDRWAAVCSHPEELLRARPAPETWCLLEYAQHTAFALGAIEWAAREFAAGRQPDWDQEPSVAGQFEHSSHECDQFDVSSTLDILASSARSMAVFALTLTPEQQIRTADYGSGWIINTAAVVRHALHDAEHHLLDVRRGIARLQLAAR